jgi:hypothetical protein
MAGFASAQKRMKLDIASIPQCIEPAPRLSEFDYTNHGPDLTSSMTTREDTPPCIHGFQDHQWENILFG